MATPANSSPIQVPQQLGVSPSRQEKLAAMLGDTNVLIVAKTLGVKLSEDQFKTISDEDIDKIHKFILDLYKNPVAVDFINNRIVETIVTGYEAPTTHDSAKFVDFLHELADNSSVSDLEKLAGHIRGKIEKKDVVDKIIDLRIPREPIGDRLSNMPQKLSEMSLVTATDFSSPRSETSSVPANETPPQINATHVDPKSEELQPKEGFSLSKFWSGVKKAIMTFREKIGLAQKIDRDNPDYKVLKGIENRFMPIYVHLSLTRQPLIITNANRDAWEDNIAQFREDMKTLGNLATIYSQKSKEADPRSHAIGKRAKEFYDLMFDKLVVLEQRNPEIFERENTLKRPNRETS